MKKFIIPIISTIVLSVVLTAGLWSIQLTPKVASTQGESVDAVFRVLFALSAVIFSLVMSFLIYAVIAFRRQPGDMEDAEPVYGNTAVEIAWTIIPLIIVVVLGTYGAITLTKMNQVSAQEELVVDVRGVQWSWSFFYPDYDITSSTLLLPVDQPVLFRLQSTDVIHSFWVPEFRVKMDVVPGITNELRITPTELGDYRALCSELCGTAHAYMTAPVMVIEGDDFDAWVNEQEDVAKAEGALGRRGKDLAGQLGCLGCHSLDGQRLVGPTFKEVFGKERTFADGTIATADEEYLKNSILTPLTQVVEGFNPLMPQNYGDRTTEEDLEALIEFIKSIE